MPDKKSSRGKRDRSRIARGEGTSPGSIGSQGGRPRRSSVRRAAVVNARLRSWREPDKPNLHRSPLATPRTEQSSKTIWRKPSVTLQRARATWRASASSSPN